MPHVVQWQVCNMAAPVMPADYNGILLAICLAVSETDLLAAVLQPPTLMHDAYDVCVTLRGDTAKITAGKLHSGPCPGWQIAISTTHLAMHAAV